MFVPSDHDLDPPKYDLEDTTCFWTKKASSRSDSISGPRFLCGKRRLDPGRDWHLGYEPRSRSSENSKRYDLESTTSFLGEKEFVYKTMVLLSVNAAQVIHSHLSFISA